jgi:predicted MFS family arabinose efflux permease
MTSVPPAALAAPKAAAAGLASLFCGIGIGRFSYTPLLPALVTAGWFGPGEAAAFGAANLVGYLAGAAAALPAVRVVPLPLLMRGMMLLVAATMALCAAQPPALVFGAARFGAGLAGGVLMVLGPPALLAAVSPGLRGRVGGAVFSGVGCGIVAASVALPLLLPAGVGVACIGLSAGALACAAIAWPFWPPHVPPAPQATSPPPGLTRLVWAYAVNAFAIVPHLLLLSDYVARWLGHGVGVGAAAFAVYGVGAALGPVIGGYFGDRVGFGRTLTVAVAIQAAAIALPAAVRTLPAAFVSALLVGALTPGIPPLVLGRAGELAGIAAAARSWRAATIAYALTQALGAFVAALAFARLRAHPPLFVAGAMFALASLAMLPGTKPGRSPHQTLRPRE